MSELEAQVQLNSALVDSAHAAQAVSSNAGLGAVAEAATTSRKQQSFESNVHEMDSRDNGKVESSNVDDGDEKDTMSSVDNDSHMGEADKEEKAEEGEEDANAEEDESYDYDEDYSDDEEESEDVEFEDPWLDNKVDAMMGEMAIQPYFYQAHGLHPNQPANLRRHRKR